MKKAYTQVPARATPARSRVRLRRELTAFLVTFALLGTLVWLGARPSSQATPYRAPVLELTLSGALATSLSVMDSSELAEVALTPTGLRFVTAGEAIDFALNFTGSETAGAGTYDLSAGVYPFTLTLLEDGEAYHTFTAQSGTVFLNDAGGTVSAFSTDETGQQLFLNARFTE